MRTTSSELCRACGLCCNGALFSMAPLGVDEQVPAVLDVETTPRGARRLRQPCPALSPDGCTVYADRPRACRGFRCLLLEAHEADEVGLPEALEIVRRTHALLRRHRPGTAELEAALRFHYLGHRTPRLAPD